MKLDAGLTVMLKKTLSMTVAILGVASMLTLTACGDRDDDRHDGVAVNGYASAPNAQSCFQGTNPRRGHGIREWNWVTDSNHGDQNPYNDRPYNNSRYDNRGYDNRRFRNDRFPRPNYNQINYSQFQSQGFCGCPYGTIPTCDAGGLICVEANVFPNQQIASWGYSHQGNPGFQFNGYINPYTQEHHPRRNSCWSGVAQTCQPGAIQGTTICQAVPNANYGVWVQR